MSHFAKVENGIVVEVIVAEQDFIDSGVVGNPEDWVQTSYNTRGNVHYKFDEETKKMVPSGGIALRGNYAGIGSTYNKTVDVFYGPQTFSSWNLNTSTWTWEAPVPSPTLNEGEFAYWDENSLSWKIDKEILIETESTSEE